MNRTNKFLLLTAMLVVVATTVFGDAADDYFNSGNGKLDKGDLDGAIGDYNKAIKLKHDFASAYQNRGNAKGRKGDLGGAIADHDKAIELEPDVASAYGFCC